MAQFNIPQFNTTRFNENGAIAATLTASDSVKFTLELRNRSSVLLAYLPDWSKATLKQTLNASGFLSFNYPALSEYASLLEFPNRIWVRDHTGTIIEKFNILPHSIEQSGVDYNRTIEAESLIGQLQRELIVNYVKTDADAYTVKNIIKDLLNSYQVQSTKINLGYIDPTIGNLVRAVNFQGKNILAAIQDLYDTVNIGAYWVDPATNTFTWKVRQGRNTGQEIRLSKNMTGIKINKDATEIINRVYVFGAGFGSSRLTLVDAGLANEYKDNSSSIATYGIIPKMFTFKDVSSASQLLEIANTILARFAAPFITYEINCVALDQVDYANFAFEKIELGNTIKIINEDLAVTTSQDVMEIERSLDDATFQTITLSNVVPDLENLFSTIQKRITTLENAEQGVESTVGDLIENSEFIQDAIASAIGSIPAIETAIQDIAEAAIEELATEEVINDVGIPSVSNFARIFNTVDIDGIDADFPSVTFRNSDFAFETTTDELYKWKGGTWQRVDFNGARLYTADNVAALPLGVAGGSFGYTTGTLKNIYCYIDAEWQSLFDLG